MAKVPDLETTHMWSASIHSMSPFQVISSRTQAFYGLVTLIGNILLQCMSSSKRSTWPIQTEPQRCGLSQTHSPMSSELLLAMEISVELFSQLDSRLRQAEKLDRQITS